MTDETTVTISKEEYFSLRRSELKLQLLENGGVDNWDWYGECLYGDMGNLSKASDELYKKVYGIDNPNPEYEE